jgi:hypothetical protein
MFRINIAVTKNPRNQIKAYLDPDQALPSYNKLNLHIFALHLSSKWNRVPDRN